MKSHTAFLYALITSIVLSHGVPLAHGQQPVNSISSGAEGAQLNVEAIASRLTSDPPLIVRKLQENGITFQSTFVNDWSRNLSHNAGTKASFGSVSLDLSATVDGKQAFGLQGNTIFVRMKEHEEEFGATGDGAAQLYSNIDGPSRTSLYEVSTEQKLYGEKLRFKVGRIDATNEFATVQSAGDFLNSSMGYSPTIMAFPTYPEPQPGVAAFLRPLNNYSLGMGIFRTSGGGSLAIVEPGTTWNVGPSKLQGRAAVGVWRLQQKLACFDGDTANASHGVYTVLEQGLWKSSATERALSGFFQFGRADGDVSPFTQHIGAGIVLQAPFRRRTHDTFGLGATRASFSSQPAAHFDHRAETIVEAYYKMPIIKHVAMVQDFSSSITPAVCLCTMTPRSLHRG